MDPIILLPLALMMLMRGGKPSGGAAFQPGLRYAPGSDAQIKLFEMAIDYAIKVPDNEGRLLKYERGWAGSSELVSILTRESNGWVGIPNYSFGIYIFPGMDSGKASSLMRKEPSTWPKVWNLLKANRNLTPKQILRISGNKSTATGLGQLTLEPLRRNYPGKEAGIGNPLAEAVGMIRYIAAAHRTPAQALEFHKIKGWY